jgi:hypothetical protein
MSHAQNDEWLEAAKDNFEEAVGSGDIAMAKAIIVDVLEAGFREAGQAMNDVLRTIPVGSIEVEDGEENEISG